MDASNLKLKLINGFSLCHLKTQKTSIKFWCIKRKAKERETCLMRQRKNHSIIFIKLLRYVRIMSFKILKLWMNVLHVVSKNNCYETYNFPSKFWFGFLLQIIIAMNYWCIKIYMYFFCFKINSLPCSFEFNVYIYV